MATIELPQLHPQTSSPDSDDREALYENGNEILRAQDNQQQSDQEMFSLPPADKGLRAWAFLAGCFFIEALVWGM